MDILSFGAGLLTGALGTGLALRLRSRYIETKEERQSSAEAKKQRRSSSAEMRFANEVVLRAQGLHLASPLFPLEEILIRPRLLSQPPIEIDEELSFQKDITDSTVPYMPDWSELASFYGAPTLSLAEMLQGGANLIVTGQPGSGRSVCLAHLAIQVARHDPETGKLANHLPLLIHAADLGLLAGKPQDPINPLVNACSVYATPATVVQLPKVIRSALQAGRILILLDGMDELSGEDHKLTVQYLAGLYKQFPTLRMVSTALPDTIDGLPALGLLPVALAAWNKSQQQAFIRQWSNQWSRYVAPSPTPAPEEPDMMLVENWLQGQNKICTPLALTLTAWAAFSGDSLGPGLLNGLEAYIRRAFSDPKAPGSIKLLTKRLEAAEELALQMMLSQSCTLDPKEAETKLTDAVGTLIVQQSGRSRFHHTIIPAFLAARILAVNASRLDSIHQQPAWNGKLLTLQFIALQDTQTTWLHRLSPNLKTDIVQRELLLAARWLAEAPAEVSWRTKIMQQLVEILRQEDTPESLRMRILCALICSNSKGTDILLRRLLTSNHEGIVQAAALGVGYTGDEQSVSSLSQLLADDSTAIIQSACLALAAIGSKSAIESVAGALVSDSFDVQRAAAEALANNPYAGYSTLIEGSQYENIAVRRASVFGLVRIQEPWAEQTLEKMHLEDEQWIVKNAAAQALDVRKQPSVRLPRPLTTPSQTPWLLEFASRYGVSIVPGDPAWDLFVKALQDGNENEILAAMHYLSLKGSGEMVGPLFKALSHNTWHLQNSAYSAIWLLGARGISVSPPSDLWMD